MAEVVAVTLAMAEALVMADECCHLQLRLLLDGSFSVPTAGARLFFQLSRGEGRSLLASLLALVDGGDGCQYLIVRSLLASACEGLGAPQLGP